MKKKVVIIGGGLGGLFTGAILSKEGLHVTVLEKNTTIGGGLQSFKRFGETFDTGMHVIGGMQAGGNIRKICNYLGILDQVMMNVQTVCILRKTMSVIPSQKGNVGLWILWLPVSLKRERIWKDMWRLSLT